MRLNDNKALVSFGRHNIGPPLRPLVAVQIAYSASQMLDHPSYMVATRMDVDTSQAATALLTEHLQYTPLVRSSAIVCLLY